MILAAISILIILVILGDAFEAVVLPRSVGRTFRLARLFYRSTWTLWTALFRREKYMAVFGPLSMLGLLVLWALGMILGFGLLNFSLGIPVRTAEPTIPATLLTYLYLSGSNFFTLGLGDVTPLSTLGKILAVTEAGTGFGFLALVLGYLPVLYTHFSRRETSISLLDARAGSPPSAAQFLMRMARSDQLPDLDRFFREWERWSAEILESHISFPVLAYYRSQHDNQSWLGALTFILDSSALVLAVLEQQHLHQTRLAYAAARHAVVDLCLVFNTPPREAVRLSPEGWQVLEKNLREAGVSLRPGGGAEAKYAELRAAYEPFVHALACYFGFRLPEILPATPGVDNWQSSAWTRRVAGIYELGPGDHFE